MLGEGPPGAPLAGGPFGGGLVPPPPPRYTVTARLWGRRLKDYFDVIGMILFSIDVVMAPFGLAWESARASRT